MVQLPSFGKQELIPTLANCIGSCLNPSLQSKVNSIGCITQDWLQLFIPNSFNILFQAHRTRVQTITVLMIAPSGSNREALYSTESEICHLI